MQRALEHGLPPLVAITNFVRIVNVSAGVRKRYSNFLGTTQTGNG